MSLISKTTAWKTLLLLAPISIGCFLLLWRSEQLADKARQTLNENPVIRQHIGTIDRIRLKLFATRLEAGSWLEQLRAGRVDWVFRVEGEKSGGLVRARFVFSRCGGHRRVLRGEDWRIDAIDAGALRLPTGVQHDLLATADSPQQAVRRVSSGQEASTAGGDGGSGQAQERRLWSG